MDLALQSSQPLPCNLSFSHPKVSVFPEREEFLAMLEALFFQLFSSCAVFNSNFAQFVETVVVGDDRSDYRSMPFLFS